MPTRDGYDLLDDLTRAGVQIIVVHGDGLRWRTDPQRDPVPDVLFEEFKQQKTALLKILLDVPDGCPVSHICTELGICPREIVAGACQVPLVEIHNRYPKSRRRPCKPHTGKVHAAHAFLNDSRQREAWQRACTRFRSSKHLIRRRELCGRRFEAIRQRVPNSHKTALALAPIVPARSTPPAGP